MSMVLFYTRIGGDANVWRGCRQWEGIVAMVSCIWPSDYGRTMAGLWPDYGRTMAGLWPDYCQTMVRLYDRTMTGLWPDYGRTMACQTMARL